jgi:hypothetical protein
MWRVGRIETREAILDFTSSGQGRRRTVQLFLDGTLFANAPDLTSWEADRFQALLCESCGVEGCKPGGWLVARRAGAYAVFLPAFEAMEQRAAEYGPPAYVLERGCPVLGEDLYGDLADPVPALPALDLLPPLTGGELARILQLEAPSDVLGVFPDPLAVRRDVIDAVSDGLLEERLDLVDACLSRYAQSSEPIDIVGEGESPSLVFYLATSPILEWSPLVGRGDQAHPRLEPGLVARPLRDPRKPPRA